MYAWHSSAQRFRISNTSLHEHRSSGSPPSITWRNPSDNMPTFLKIRIHSPFNTLKYRRVVLRRKELYQCLRTIPIGLLLDVCRCHRWDSSFIAETFGWRLVLVPVHLSTSSGFALGSRGDMMTGTFSWRLVLILIPLSRCMLP
jgi:hypothetical protein